MTGFVQRKMESETRPPPSRWVVRVTEARASGGCGLLLLGDELEEKERSIPAQKVRLVGSLPVRTMHFTRGSEERRVKALSRESIMSVLKAFLASGRLRMTSIIGVTVGLVEGWCSRRMVGRERFA